MRSSRWRTGALLAAVSLLSTAMAGSAQSVRPMRMDPESGPSELAVDSAGEAQRLDAAIYETPILEAGSFDDQTVHVPRSVVDDICGDDDGCTMRLVWVDDWEVNPGPITVSTWWFGIRELGQWRARPPGGALPIFGDISNTPHEVVGQVASGSGSCKVRDDNGTNGLGFPYQRLEVIAEASAEPAEDSFHCLLRIDD